jgi:tetratricopeptide (TPR) repeat protein
VSSSLVNYVLGRVAVEAAERGDGDVSEQTIGLLDTGRNGADQATLAEIDEYIARAHYLLQQYASALEFINAALDREPSVMRHYVRGLVLEARGQDDDAAREYDWVIAWSSVYPSDQLANALARLEALR